MSWLISHSGCCPAPPGTSWIPDMSKANSLKVWINNRYALEINVQDLCVHTHTYTHTLRFTHMHIFIYAHVYIPTHIHTNIRWIMEKARKFQKNIYFCFIDYAKAFDCVDHNKLWKVLKEMGIPDHLTCLLRNLYAGQEATVRTGHGTIDWFQIGKGERQGCILSPCLFKLIGRVHHEKRWAGWSTSWDQDCREKYQ